jgi:hypothetical protein
MEERVKDRSELLEKGEIVRVRSKLGVFPEITCRVQGVSSGFAQFSIGNMEFCAPLPMIEIIGRETPERYDPLIEEIVFLRHQLTFCSCRDCKERLAKLEEQRAT